MIIATDKRDDNLEVDEIISRHVRVASLYSFGIKRLAKQWTSPNYILYFWYYSSLEVLYAEEFIPVHMCSNWSYSTGYEWSSV